MPHIWIMPHFYFATTPAWVIWLTQMRHVPYINEWYPIFESCHTSILLPHLSKCTQMGHFAHPNEACPHVQNTLICIYVDMYMYTYVNVFIHKMSQRCTFMYTRTMHIKMRVMLHIIDLKRWIIEWVIAHNWTCQAPHRKWVIMHYMNTLLKRDISIHD